jgi:hypothetical protein
MTAAVPPSAETEWERMTCTFETTAIFKLESISADEIAALRPANPDPIIIMS